MKQLATILTFLISFITTAQQSYPNNKPELLAGKNVTVRDLEYMHKAGYRYFYSNKQLTDTYMPAKSDKDISSYEDLLGQNFKVVAVEPMGKDTRIVLENKKGKLVYYKYNKWVESFMFPFVVEGGLSLPADFYCDYLNAATGNFRTKKIDGFSFGQDKNQLSLEYTNFPGKAPEVTKGVTFILDNHAEIYFNYAKVDLTKSSDNKCIAYTHYILDENEIARLKGGKIVKVLLGDASFDVTEGETLKGILNCMFPALPANSSIEATDYCSSIRIKKISNDTRGFFAEEVNVFYFSAAGEKDRRVYMLRLYNSIANRGEIGKGVTIELENGETISSPLTKVEKNPESHLTAEFELSELEFSLLKAYKIRSYKLNNTGEKINVRDAKKLQEILRCLDTK